MLGAQKATSDYLTNADPIQWRIYAALGRDKLIFVVPSRRIQYIQMKTIQNYT